nr:protein-L-isoaspartate(D-aspartate) O-methyltransferase [Pseudohoeflea sp. DP4N28-3]
MLEKEGFAALVLRLRSQGIGEPGLLAALEQTPRSLFIGPAHAAEAYDNRLMPLDCGSFAESPDLVARILDLAGLKSGHRVLDVGTGSGFLAGVAGRIAERVMTIDRYRTLTTLAQQRYQHLGVANVVARQGDGLQGVPGEGTFDRIIVTAAFESMPRNYVDFLVSEGVMVAPLRDKDGVVRMARLTRIGNRFEREDFFAAPYLPLVPGVSAAL